MEETLKYHCALASCHTIPSHTKLKLLEQFGSLMAIFAASKSRLQAAGLNSRQAKAIMSINWPQAETAANWFTQPDRTLITMDSPLYPERLRHIDEPPLQLFVEGDPASLSQPQISIVGSRRATVAGQHQARDLSRQLVRYGLTITSGLALGIDTAAHQGALEGNGKTIAVLGNGIDNIYPVKNLNLAQKIYTQGAVVSEYPPSTLPLSRNFPQRNRIISGLSHGTVVVEAALRSGSLITARLALEQGREVFAMPGSILNPMTRGCHQLIKAGAKLVETSADVIEEIALNIVQEVIDDKEHSQPSKEKTKADPGHKLVLDIIGFDPISVDNIIDRSGLTAQQVSSILLEMELSGVIQTQPGGTVMRVA